MSNTAALAELDVSRTALLLIDMQNDYLAPDGYFASRGADMSTARNIVPPLQQVLHSFRAAGMPVFHTQFSLLPGYPDIPETHRILGSQFVGAENTRLVRGTRGVEIIEDLAPLPSEQVILKPTILSGFVATELEVLLRRRKIDTLIVGGLATHACILHTCYDAFARDFAVVVLSDGVATFAERLQAPSIDIIETLLGASATSAQVVEWCEKAAVDRV